MSPVSALSVLLAVGAVARLEGQCPDGSPPPCARAATAIAPHSVAVLYFDNLSRDTANAYLADGLTEELIVRLGNVHRIEVKSRFESQRVRGGAARDPRALGRSLRAAYLVSGSLQQAGPRVRLNVSLVRTASGAQVWGSVYDRSGADVLQIQSDIAAEVAGAITGQLLPEERATLTRRPTNDPVAYDLYLRGIAAANGLSEQGLRTGLELLDRAIARDSNFADAYARQALIWTFIADSYVTGREGYEKTREAAERALRRDSSQVIAWSVLSWAVIALDFDGAEGLRLARRAASLEPGGAMPQGALAAALVQTGHLDEAVLEARRGWLADTLSTAAAIVYAWVLQHAHQVDTLEAVLPRMRLAFTAGDLRELEGLARLQRRDGAGAAERFTLEWFGGWFAGEKVRALVMAGRRDAAVATKDSILAMIGHGYFNAFAAAEAYAALGDADSTFLWLDRAYEQRTFWLIALPWDEGFTALHADSRFAALLRKMGRTP